ncbi:MAG: restriction endonuclease subunit S [archaeon]
METSFTKISLGDEKYFQVDNGERIRKEDINKAEGNIPVYSSSKYKGESLGFVSDKIKEIVPKSKKFSGECITINADATDYSAFFRDETFYANDVLNIIITKSDEIYLPFVAIEINNILPSLGLNKNNKLYKGKLRNLEIKIPLRKDGKFDLEKQKEIVSKFNKIESIKDKLKLDYDRIENLNVEIILEGNKENFSFDKIFELKKGNSKYTKKYVNVNEGEFPVYSSNTKNNGILGSINSFDYNIECVQITTNGVYAGTIFYRPKHKFSINSDAKLLVKKSNHLDYEFLLWKLKILFKEKGFNWKNKVGDEKLYILNINVPIDEKGEFDLEKQKEIAEKYNLVEEIKERIRENYQRIINLKVEILSD